MLRTDAYKCGRMQGDFQNTKLFFKDNYPTSMPRADRIASANAFKVPVFNVPYFLTRRLLSIALS